MTLQTLFVVNRAGGLIYSRELSPGGKLSGNEYLVLASTFHSLHAISKQLAPVPSGGITSVDAPTFSLHCLESPTGMKFFTTAKPNTRDVHGFLRKVYEFYADFVLKNPFYELDMPIRLRVRVLLSYFSLCKQHMTPPPPTPRLFYSHHIASHSSRPSAIILPSFRVSSLPPFCRTAL